MMEEGCGRAVVRREGCLGAYPGWWRRGWWWSCPSLYIKSYRKITVVHYKHYWKQFLIRKKGIVGSETKLLMDLCRDSVQFLFIFLFFLY